MTTFSILLKLEMKKWLGRQGSNLGMSEPKTDALPLGDAPTRTLL